MKRNASMERAKERVGVGGLCTVEGEFHELFIELTFLVAEYLSGRQ